MSGKVLFALGRPQISGTPPPRLGRAAGLFHQLPCRRMPRGWGDRDLAELLLRKPHDGPGLQNPTVRDRAFRPAL